MNERIKSMLIACGIVVAIGLVFALATAIHWDDPKDAAQRMQLTHSIDQTPRD